ncbi:hypothetical protein [Lysinibacillus pakistanensis]|uniref:hypothetical protein n=1 Tax=Lysinibacillus pakistanensis TaxID=759811 RepID=UPI003D29347E
MQKILNLQSIGGVWVENSVLYEFSKEYSDSEVAYKNLINMDENLWKLGLNLADYSKGEAKQFLKFLRELLDTDEDVLMLGGRKVPNRRLIHHLLSESTIANLESLINKTLAEFEKGSNFYVSNIDDIGSVELRVKRADEIRSLSDKDMQSQHDLLVAYKVTYIKELEKKYANTKGIKERLQVITEAYMTLDQILFQAINYFFIANPNNSIANLIQVKEEISLFLNSYQMPQDKQKNSLFVDFIYIINKVHKTTYFNTVNKIYDALEQGIEKNIVYREVQPKYQKHNQEYIGSWESRSLMQYVFERTLVKNDRTDRFLKRKEFIEVLKTRYNRKLDSSYMQHFKACYREVYLSPIKFNNKSCTKIADIVIKGNDKVAYNEESMFIREKVSMSLFREKGLLEGYLLKNQIQKQLYNKLSLIFSVHDLDYQIKSLFELYEGILSILIGVLKR